MYLDSLSPLDVQVGYGNLGMNGSLGYEDKNVIVKGKTYAHALSAHAPSRLMFQLDECYAQFECSVALNDDSPSAGSHAHFLVYADGLRVACEAYVVAGESPRPLYADITGAKTLELVIETPQWEYCHTIWLDPVLEEKIIAPRKNFIEDCLGRASIHCPSPLPEVDCCIATIASPGWERLLDNLLGSLKTNGNCPDARLVVFDLGASAECRKISQHYGATLIPCQARAGVNSTIKSVLYSAARLIPAKKFICLDADMLVLGDLQPILSSIDVAPTGSLFAVREANGSRFSRLDQAINYIYSGNPKDLKRLLGYENGESSYSLIVNDGIFAGSCTALLTLDGQIRQWKYAQSWVDERRDVWWRNQFIFNLVLAHLDCGIELDPAYNIQLNSQSVQMQRENGHIYSFWQHHPVRILHFNGSGRRKYDQWQGLFQHNSGSR